MPKRAYQLSSDNKVCTFMKLHLIHTAQQDLDRTQPTFYRQKIRAQDVKSLPPYPGSTPDVPLSMWATRFLQPGFILPICKMGTLAGQTLFSHRTSSSGELFCRSPTSDRKKIWGLWCQLEGHRALHPRPPSTPRDS